MESVRILVVDDDPAFLSAVVRLFGQHDVDLAPNASAAVVIARCRNHHVAIVDVFLVGSSGIELVPQLRREHAARTGRRLPVVLVSGGDDIESLALACDADRFLAKPMTPDDLRSAVAEAVSGAAPIPGGPSR